MRQWIVHIILCVLVLCGMSNVAQAQCVPSHLPYYANDQLRNFNFPSCWFVHCDYGSWGISYTPGSDIYSFDMSCDTTIDGYGLVVFDTIAESLDGKYLVYDAMCSSSGGVVFDVGLCTSVSPVVFTEVCRDTVTTASGGRGVSRLSGEGRLALRIRYDAQISGARYRYIAFNKIRIVSSDVLDARITEVLSNAAVLEFDTIGSPSAEVRLRPEGSTTWRTVDDTVSPVNLEGLMASTIYDVEVITHAGTYTDTIALHFKTTQRSESCLNAADLNASNVTCYYGSFWDPYTNTGIIDNGYASMYSRHTVHFDPYEVDPRTDSLLHTVPPTGGLSVRLGNWNTGAEGEAVAYRIAVDTDNFAAIIFSYAAVMQNPGHTESNQPLLYIQVLDTLGAALDTQCVYARFISSSNLGWNVYTPSTYDTILWKEWTSVGLNLSAYHGQTIVLRVTTLDCSQSGHYGYAYFTLDCAGGGISVLTCRENVNYSYAAIPGFDHRWYRADNPATFSTADTITLSASQPGIIYCEHTNRAKPDCKFVERIDNVAHIPVAKFTFTYTPVLCSYRVFFKSTSVVTSDGSTPVADGSRINYVRWEREDGSQRLGPRDTLLLTPGIHTVKIVAATGSNCVDSNVVLISLPAYVPDTVYYYDTICQRSAYTGYGFTLDADATDHYPSYGYVRMDVDTNLCPLAHKLVLSFYPVGHRDTYDTIVQGDVYPWGDTLLTLSGEYDNTEGVTSHGCDSVARLNLAVVKSHSSFVDSCSAHIDILAGDTLVITPVPFEFRFGTEWPAHQYSWTPGDGFDDDSTRNPRISLPPDTSASYRLTVTYEDTVNIIPNGLFDMGDTIFGSDYTSLPSPSAPDSVGSHSGVYAVMVPSPSHPGIADCLGGATRSLVTYPADTTGLRLYYITIAVDPYTDYRLSYSVAGMAAPDTVALVWTVDGDPVGSAEPFLPESCSWNRQSIDFETQAQTLITLAVSDTSYRLGSRAPFAVDSLQLHRLCRAVDSVAVRTECPVYDDTVEVLLCHDSSYVLVDGTSIDEPGLYTATVQTLWGCDSTVTVRAVFNPCCSDFLQFPNLVTPNGDGINDRFVIVGLLEEWCYPFNELAIYNKWGQRVFYRKNIVSDADFWDPNDGNWPDGTYYFHFDAKSPDEAKHVQRRGVIEVLRDR